MLKHQCIITILGCDLMSIEDCSERPEMGDTNEVNEDSAPVPTTNDCGHVL